MLELNDMVESAKERATEWKQECKQSESAIRQGVRPSKAELLEKSWDVSFLLM